MLRITLYIGVPSPQNPKTALEQAGAKVWASTAGGWEIRRGNYHAHVMQLGTKTVAAVNYRVIAVLVDRGDQWRAYRWLKMIPGVVGPYTRWSVPAAMKTLLRELSAIRAQDGSILELGDTRSASLLSGEILNQLDARDYVEGASTDGSQDEVTE